MSVWQPGDLALCIRGQEPISGIERAPNECSQVVSMLFPRIGSEWRVASIELRAFPPPDGDVIYLGLEGQPCDFVYDSRCFRKIDSHTADGEDEETIRLLNAVPERAA